MATFTEDAAQSLRGSLELLQRQARGMARFDCSARGFRRSFAAIPLAIPAFVALVAANRAKEGLLTPGAFLFTDVGPVWRAAVDFACIWAAPILVAFWAASILDLRRRFAALVVGDQLDGCHRGDLRRGAGGPVRTRTRHAGAREALRVRVSRSDLAPAMVHDQARARRLGRRRGRHHHRAIRHRDRRARHHIVSRAGVIRNRPA